MQRSEVFIYTMMDWHFSKETGAEFWLRLADELDFNPIRDIKTFRNLKKNPDISSRLRTVRVETLIPKGVAGLQPAVYESGRTTGNPKFFIAYEEWINRPARWFVAPHQDLGGNMPAFVPIGPHIVGDISCMKARHMGGLCFKIDLDPRWVRRSIQQGNTAETELNSSSNNPLICPDNGGDVFHNGCFYGQYIAMAMDYLSISLTTLCNSADRRIDRFLTAANNNGLPAFLCRKNPGLKLGLMGGQFMSASLNCGKPFSCNPAFHSNFTDNGGFSEYCLFWADCSAACP